MSMRLVSAIACMAGFAASAWGAGGTTESGLVVLDESASGALRMVGNSKVLVPARAVYVNSSSNRAVSATGNATLDAPYLYVVGKADFGANSECTGQIVRSAAPYADPLAGMSFPTTNSMPNRGSRSIGTNATAVLEPGYYTGISISGNSNVTFSPGVYLIGGSGLEIRGNGTVVGQGVTLIINSGELDIAGNGSVVFTPPSSGSYANIVIAQPPSNRTGMSLAGNGNLSVSGTIYAPRALLTLVGNSAVEGQGPQMGDIVIAERVSLNGNAEIRIGREESRAIVLPKMPLYD